MKTGKEFWANVDKKSPDKCWPWKRGTNNYGYGAVWWENELQPAHRIAYQLQYGEIDDHLPVSHICGTISCCNPTHLVNDYLGKGGGKGERNGNVKMTAEQVIEMRRLHRGGATYTSLSKMFNCHRSTVRNVCTGSTWSHIKEGFEQ